MALSGKMVIKNRHLHTPFKAILAKIPYPDLKKYIPSLLLTRSLPPRGLTVPMYAEDMPHVSEDMTGGRDTG